jgi:hypothetical protein
VKAREQVSEPETQEETQKEASMKLRSLFYALAVFLSLSASAVGRAQEGPTKGQLGYGFEPGLVAGKDFVADQLIVILKEGGRVQGLVQAAVATGGTVLKEIEGTAVLVGFGSEERLWQPWAR